MKLFDYQVEDAQFLATRKFAGLFSGMGTGKTRIALEACVMVEAKKILIIGPPISLPMWQVEIKDHLGVDALILKTGKTPINNADVLICSYTIATTRQDELAGMGFDVCVLDESHAVKTPTAKRTRAIIGYGTGRYGSIADRSKQVFLLTGTPSVRWADDLYTFLARACPERLREKIGGLSLDKFQLRYCITQQRQFGKGRFKKKVKVTVGNRNAEELRDMMFSTAKAVEVSPSTRRELAEVWAAMPELTISRTEIGLDMSADLRKALKSVEGMTMAQIQEGLAAKEPALASIRRELGVAKVKASISELTARIQEGNGPILVGVWHRDVIDGLRAGLLANGIKVGVIDGRSTSNQKKGTEWDWNNGKLDILLGQIAACGVSLNLQRGGRKIVEIEQDWSPAITAQFRARLHRIGQINSVNCEVWSSDTKLDKAINQISHRKAKGHGTMMDSEGAA